MRISGNIEVYKNDKMISFGKNLITNVGKSIFLDWFTQQNYINNDKSVYNGNPLVNERFLDVNEFRMYGANINAGNIIITQNNYYDFYSGESGATIQNNHVIYCQLNEVVDLSGMYFNVNGGFKYIKIYTSTQYINESNQNKKWILRKLVLPNFILKNIVSHSKMVRFDSIDDSDGSIDSVRSIKIEFSYSKNTTLTIKGIGLLKKSYYPNVPCALGLGSSNLAPTPNDIDLSQKQCKIFINKQYCNIQLQQNGQQSVIYNKVDLNKNLLQYKNLKKIDIVYVARLNYQQYNGINFNQVGLYFPSKQVVYKNGVETCDKLFSHGLFEHSWSKNNNQIIDIKYIISLGV